jgi:hypothetical protein
MYLLVLEVLFHFCFDAAIHNLNLDCFEKLHSLTFPDNDDYEVSWVEFKTEQLENFNWNRMDFYVCTRGGDKVCSF